MAWDYLAIQGSATPLEHAFSSGGITGCTWRNRLQPAVFEGLQLLKSAYQNGHLSAGTQVACHAEVSIDSDEEMGDNFL